MVFPFLSVIKNFYFSGSWSKVKTGSDWQKGLSNYYGMELDMSEHSIPGK